MAKKFLPGHSLLVTVDPECKRIIRAHSAAHDTTMKDLAGDILKTWAKANAVVSV